MNTPNTLPQRFGPWSVVTGASDGIGRAFAMELVKRGVNLVLVARRQAVLEELAAKLQHEHGVACDAVSTDLSRPAGDPKLVSRTKDRDVGLLVAAAGFGTSGPFLDNSVDAELEMIDVNCRAVAALAHAYGGRLVARGGGGLVLMSSLLAFQGVPRAANYAATKAHVQVLAEGLRRELAPANVEVLAVAPGPIDSGFAARVRMTMRISENPEVVARGALAALGRRGTTRPGRLSKLLEGSLAILPRQLRTRIMGQVMADMTKCA